ncbi:MAG: hypothetical protein FJZ01_23700 [Candidatus Sericytochromatia bacterium]|nr:hypothetical protein [Candidatus Tanganyikabacteria bacterium]
MSFDALSGFGAPVRRDGAPQDRPVPPPIDDRPAPPRGDRYQRSSDRPTPPPVSGSRDRDYDRPTPPPVSRDYDRPTPPPVSRDYDRPTPPPVGRDYGRPTPPPVYGGDYDRPTPPPVYNDRPVPPPVRPYGSRPRYYWMPAFPVMMPTSPQPLPQIAPPPAPAPARRVDPSEVSVDVYQLLGEAGRLRKRSKFLWLFTIHPKISAGEAKTMLAAGKPVYVGPDSGWHFASKYNQISGEKQLDSYLGEARSNKLGQLQAAEDRAYQGRLSAWRETDIQNRVNRLPGFNSIYDTNRLMMANYFIWEDGRQFNRSLITAMNIYNQPDTRREIARKWSENPNMSNAEFNLVANGVISRKASNLYWDANWAGSDWGIYLGNNPVPGLRFPDYQEDVEWNADIIRRTASELPLLLNSAVLTH